MLQGTTSCMPAAFFMSSHAYMVLQYMVIVSFNNTICLQWQWKKAKIPQLVGVLELPSKKMSVPPVERHKRFQYKNAH